jgi:outer membrane protein OmpA-like peptidoglycan-associated protein
MRVHPLSVLALCAAIVPAAHAQLKGGDAVKNGKDHPLLSRFEGSKMVAYDVRQYDEATLVTSKPYYRNNEMVLDSTVKVEGKYTRIAYVYEKDRSSLEVFRNYQAALEKAGLKTVYSCALEACGEHLGSYMLRTHLDKDGFIQGGYRNSLYSGQREPRYLVAKGMLPDGSAVHVAVYVIPPARGDFGGVLLQVVEGKPMETGKVAATLKAGDMARSIASDGKVAVYGVYFDTDRTAVKPESKEALAEMAKLLQQDRNLKVHIVGHTDNQGSPAHNMELSQKRAESVARLLSTDYRIDATRLSAKGVGAYAPVASNDAEPGREKNRRVELVKQ